MRALLALVPLRRSALLASSGLFAAVILAGATAARGDVSLDAQRPLASARASRAPNTPRAPHAPHTPIGPRCDAALAAAQREFTGFTRDVDFHVRERHVVGTFEWSDMCGVWGNYSVELAPDLRAAQSWRWTSRTASDQSRYHRHGVRRASGWRATFVLDADTDDAPLDTFVDLFRPAVDVCLAEAATATTPP